jgi:hypothetical protein
MRHESAFVSENGARQSVLNWEGALGCEAGRLLLTKGDHRLLPLA